ncbi:MAG: hypothetical protein SGBAC_013525, partial [Bacillariaceae sp.]
MESSLPNNPYDSRKPEINQTEAFLAAELKELSAQEREEAFDDVHCVGVEIQETPEIIQRSLADFEEAVQKQRNPVYDAAMNQNRAYVEDTTFRLKFLRAKLYNVREAV